jgi:2-hydroxychromene-2-carboxylate isomerase
VVPELFYDVGSPYAYLAVERFEAVVGVAPVLSPVLLGGIFKATGRSSWGLTDAREDGMRGIERRAREAGLPPMTWPDPWPGDYLVAMRAVTFLGDDYARALMRAAFQQGQDHSRLEMLAALAPDPDALRDAVNDPEVKARLRAATDRALALGVMGIPTTRVGATLYWGDDRLEDVAQALR